MRNTCGSRTIARLVDAIARSDREERWVELDEDRDVLRTRA
jgi:hypothetical protein